VFKERPSRNTVPVTAETVLSNEIKLEGRLHSCLLYTSPSPRD